MNNDLARMTGLYVWMVDHHWCHSPTSTTSRFELMTAVLRQLSGWCRWGDLKRK